jgi:formamidase
VIAPVDVSALRHERQSRQGHHMLAHLRTEAYPVYARHAYPPAPIAPGEASVEANQTLISRAKREASFVEQEVVRPGAFFLEEPKNF